MKIQITTAVPLEQTPVDIALMALDQRNREKIAQGTYQLKSQKEGEAFAVQTDDTGYFLRALITMPVGTEKFELEEAEPPKSIVNVLEHDEQLDIFLPGGVFGTLFGTYHFQKTAPRPYIWPLHGPDGVELTRAFPMDNREGEKHDHPHHRSLWTAFDEVNQVNNWHEGEGHGWTRHQRFLDQIRGPVYGGFGAELLWTNAEGEPFLTEIRHVQVYNVDSDVRVFDYSIHWIATHGDVTFGDTKEAGVLAIRASTSMDGERGGVITNSNGGRGEKECWGKRADWCDYTGEVNGGPYGITVFSHPQNYGGAPRWHVRDYGLFATNPFSVAAFEGGEKQVGFLESVIGEKVMEKNSARFGYRVLLHKGEASDKIKQMAESWKHPPQVTIEP